LGRMFGAPDRHLHHMLRLESKALRRANSANRRSEGTQRSDRLELVELLRKRHMCREFEDTPVERKKLLELVKAANRAPQGGNMPVREFMIVDDPSQVKLVRAVTPSFLANAPAVIVIFTDLERALDVMGIQGRDVLSLLDAGAAAENVALRAIEFGLAVSFVRSATTEALKGALDIPDRYRIDILVGVGYARMQNRSAPLKGRPPTIHVNGYQKDTMMKDSEAEKKKGEEEGKRMWGNEN
jgi:nitroreductase